MAKLLGSGSKGRTNNPKAGKAPGATPGTALTDPSKAGNIDVVARNLAAATQGAMESKQLRKNKSTGISVGKLKRKK